MNTRYAPSAPLSLTLAQTLHESGRLHEAAACYQQLLAAAPEQPQLLGGLGTIALQLGDFEHSAQLLGRALQADPQQLDALLNRGAALAQLGRRPEALTCYDAALVLAPDFAQAHYNRGLVLQGMQRPAEAATAYRQAIALQADYTQAYNNLGNALMALTQTELALDAFNAALRLDSQYADALHNQGHALHTLKRYTDALVAYRQALALQPGNADIHYHCGNTYKELNQVELALASYQAALALDPLHAEAQWNKAYVCLLMGDYAQGWRLAEWRWQGPLQAAYREFAQPLWLGDADLAGQTLLIHAEQGLGDFIQCYRYVALAEAAGAQVWLETPPALLSLLSPLPAQARLFASGSPLPAFDRHCPIMSLPLAFATRMETIPAPIPYVSAAADKLAWWQTRLGKAERPRIGIVWSGSATHKNDAQRSLPLASLADLLTLPFEFHVLQNQLRTEDSAALAQFNGLQVHCACLTDFAETAALTAAMDLVISVDTSLAHLAGAMGKPVWILLPFAPDYRWLLARSDSPWYPSARLFRQSTPGDWASVLTQLAEQLLAEFAVPEAGEDEPAPAFTLADQARLQYAQSLHQQGRLQDAAQAYEQLLQVFPEHPQVLASLGQLAFQQGFFEAADILFENALAQDASQAELWFKRGIALAMLKRLDEALASFDAAIALQADYADAYSNRSNVLQMQQRFEEALAGYAQALALKPAAPEIHNNRGNVLLSLNRPAQAIASFDSAIALKADYADAHFNRANAWVVLQDYAEALKGFNHATALKPQFADAYINRGNCYGQLQDFQRALESYDRSLTLLPGSAEVYFNRGNSLRELQRLPEALDSYDRAIAANSDFAAAFYNRGLVLHAIADYAQALRSYEQAIALQPAYADAYYNRGNALRSLRRFTEAVTSYRQAIALQPGYADAYFNCGLALRDLYQPAEAIVCYQAALAIRADLIDAYIELGDAQKQLNELDAAAASFEQALRLDPDYPAAQWNKALLLLLRGDYQAGWRLYEARWQDQLKTRRRDYPQALWLGKQPLTGKTLLVHTEQGLGDFIQFSRYLPLVEALAAKVVVEAQAALLPLLASLPGRYTLVAQGDVLPDFDVHSPILSLPLAFDTRLESIPAQVPYLWADAAKQRVWREHLGRKTRPRIGLVWSGSMIDGKDHNRSLALAQLVDWLALPYEFHVLQKDIRAEDVQSLADFSQLHDHHLALTDFAETAALLDEMDLVISVCTSVAHLAGAMGKPVWIMLPYAAHFVWLTERHDSPWYPSARLFRQPAPGDWRSAINTIHQELSGAISGSVIGHGAE